MRRFGDNFLHNPLTKISSISPSDEDLLKLRQLDSYDVIIFTSQSAAKFGASFLKEHIKDNLEIPIIRSVVDIIEGSKSVEEVLQTLLNRPLGEE